MQPYGIPSYGAAAGLQERNKVLRNTYLLLALSMIPTIAGALLGMQMHFMLKGILVPMLVFIGVSFAFMFMIERNKHSSMGVVLLLAFTFFMGFWLSQLLQVALMFRNGAQAIGLAGGATATIFFALSTLATVTKKDFSFLGKFLFIGLIVMLVAGIANMFLHLPVMTLVLCSMGALIFSLYILYDVSRVVNGGETNYITAALAIYLDIYGLFQNLLVLILSLTGNDD
ncbi:Bax inhibitor-1 family protein [Leeia sp.]|uniref:Bax inhibitor-1 family protein n=1 Tax=Leeia sp. TaxID=2884678 RepID=UPI0035B0D0FC